MIGEHTDYTGGFVMPLALERGTVVYGVGRLVRKNEGQQDEKRREQQLALFRWRCSVLLDVSGYLAHPRLFDCFVDIFCDI